MLTRRSTLAHDIFLYRNEHLDETAPGGFNELTCARHFFRIRKSDRHIGALVVIRRQIRRRARRRRFFQLGNLLLQRRNFLLQAGYFRLQSLHGGDPVFCAFDIRLLDRYRLTRPASWLSTAVGNLAAVIIETQEPALDPVEAETGRWIDLQLG